MKVNSVKSDKISVFHLQADAIDTKNKNNTPKHQMFAKH